jgi:signal transduction histidine kinase
MSRTLEHRVEARTVELAAAVRVRDDFLVLASHELRTPITSLKLQLQLLRRDIHVGHAGPLSRRLEILTRQANRLGRLVDTLIEVSAIGEQRLTLSPQPTDLGELTASVIDALEGDLNLHNCSVRVQLQRYVIGMWDPHGLEQIVANLIINAAKYGANAPITVSLYADEETATLEVRDRGTGISPEALERIFGCYERLTPKREGGLGLGLYVVDQLVRAMGGDVSATSELGKGACFVVRLPRQTGVLPPAAG